MMKNRFFALNLKRLISILLTFSLILSCGVLTAANNSSAATYIKAVFPEPDIHLDMSVDEGLTTAYDISGNGYNATFGGTNAPTATSGAGNDTTALTLNKSNIQIANHEGVSFNKDMSVSVTFKLSYLGEAAAILASNYDHATAKFDFLFQITDQPSGHKLRFTLQDSGNYWVPFTTDVTPTSNEWHTVIASVKGNDVTIYYDGEIVFTDVNKQGRRTASTGNPIMVGSSTDGYQYLYATVSDFKLADEATSFIEVDNSVEVDGGVLKLPEADLHFDMTADADLTTVYDTSENRHHAEIIGTGKPTVTTGPEGDSSALTLGTSLLKVTSPDYCSFNSDFTVKLTFYQTATTASEQMLVSKRDLTNNKREFQIYTQGSSNTLAFLVRTGSTWTTCAGVALTLNEWHTVIASVKDKVMYLYLDGVLLNTTNITATRSAATDAPIGIGGDGASGGNRFQGIISDAQLSDEGCTFIAAPDELDPIPFPEADAHIDMSVDGGITTAYDVSGKGYNASVIGAPTVTEGPEGDDTALEFDNDYLKIPSPQDFNFSGDFSIEVTFMQTEYVAAEQMLLCKRNLSGGKREFQLFINSDNTINFLVNISGTNWTRCVGTVPSLNKWHTAVATVKDNVLKLYLDGVLLNMTVITEGRAASTDAPIGIGADPSGNSYFKGQIADVKLSDETVTNSPLIIKKDADTKVLTLEAGAAIFSDRSYTFTDAVPDYISGMKYNLAPIAGNAFTVQTAGILYALTPLNITNAATQETALKGLGFKQLEGISFQSFGSNDVDKVNLFYKQVIPGETFSFGKWVLVLSEDLKISSSNYIKDWANNSGEVLYNGITLPAEWPPTYPETYYNGLPVPYLTNKPAVININTGRQLFVDNFLIESTTLTREWHKAEKYDGNPILKPETEQELGRVRLGKNGLTYAPTAAPFSGGVWYDSNDKLFKMWYNAGLFDGTALATSKDGINWERPDLDVVEGTNLILPLRDDSDRDSAAVIYDPFTSKINERFKMFLWSRPNGGEVFTSPDGIHWSDSTPVGQTGDRSTIFYNPFRKKWVYSIRSEWWYRTRDYHECDDLIEGADLVGSVRWASTDTKDIKDPDIGDFPQLYNLDAVAYESVMLGAFTILVGPNNLVCIETGEPKITELHMAFSRDGFHWARSEDRTPFINATREDGSWEKGYLHSNAAVCMVNDDELWFYYTGFEGDTSKKGPGYDTASHGMYCYSSTGLATLRRDGFASMNAVDTTGTLTTETVTFDGKHLFVNVDAPEGSLKVEILDENGNVLEGFSESNAVTGDLTKSKVFFGNNDDISSLSGKNVKFRFTLTNGKLYSFWVSDDEIGSSNGYLGGGSVDQNGLVDNVSSYNYKLGDLNDDGKLDLSDFVSWRQKFIGKNVNAHKKASDVNGDGKTDICDLVALEKKLKK